MEFFVVIIAVALIYMFCPLAWSVIKLAIIGASGNGRLHARDVESEPSGASRHHRVEGLPMRIVPTSGYEGASSHRAHAAAWRANHRKLRSAAACE
jgi:hypothetical protein